MLDCLLGFNLDSWGCSKGSEITRWVSIILNTAGGYIIKYSNGVSPLSPCQPRTPEPSFLLLPDDIFLFILTLFMTRGAAPVGGGCGLKGKVLTVLTVIIPQMNSNSYRSYLQGSHVAWIMLLRITTLTRDLRNVIKMWRIPVPDWTWSRQSVLSDVLLIRCAKCVPWLGHCQVLPISCWPLQNIRTIAGGQSL